MMVEINLFLAIKPKMHQNTYCITFILGNSSKQKNKMLKSFIMKIVVKMKMMKSCLQVLMILKLKTMVLQIATMKMVPIKVRSKIFKPFK